MIGQPGFFDLSDRYAALSAAGDPLERLTAVVDFEVFRGPLIVALRRSDLGKGGRPPFDPVMMFKILVLQALYSLSDEATEFQIKDRLSFQRFLGLGLDGRVPDATTVWLFRERLVQAKAIDKLFARFDAALTDRGYLAMGGQIIDATVVPAPKQRNTEDEKAAIKQGKIGVHFGDLLEGAHVVVGATGQLAHHRLGAGHAPPLARSHLVGDHLAHDFQDGVFHGVAKRRPGVRCLGGVTLALPSGIGRLAWWKLTIPRRLLVSHLVIATRRARASLLSHDGPRFKLWGCQPAREHSPRHRGGANLA